jgi:hypothetical protein
VLLLLQTVFSVEYECSVTISAAYSLSWTFDNANSIAYFKVVSTAAGYVSVGFPTANSNMIGAEAVIGSSTIGVKPYKLNGKTQNSVVVDTAATIFDTSFTRSGGTTTMTFARAFNNGGSFVIQGTASNKFIWAYHSTNTGVVSHTSRGASTTGSCTTGMTSTHSRVRVRDRMV